MPGAPEIHHLAKPDENDVNSLFVIPKKYARMPDQNLLFSEPPKHFLAADIRLNPGDKSKSKCPSLKPPTIVPVEKFQPFRNGDTSAYFFSAYHDTRNGRNELRIISVMIRGLVSHIWCQAWYLNGKESHLETIPATIMVLPESSGRLYDGCWVTCRLPEEKPGRPQVVSLSQEECSQSDNALSVVHVKTESPETVSFAVCVTPFNLNYDKVEEFLEIMTLNRIFGADHVFFYNYSSSPRIRRLTEAMFKEGFATVVQWRLPMKVHVWPVPKNYVEEVKYFGQMAMLQECLMRGMGKYKFLVYTDMDELAVPRQHRNWRELYEAHGFLERPAACVTFRNTFFKLEWASDEDSLRDPKIVASGARTLLKTHRERTIFSPGSRSKYIVDPLQIRTCGVHNIWEADQPTGAVTTLSPSDGLLHHYRNWTGLGEKTFEIDRNMLRFRDVIIEKYEQAKEKYLKLLL